MSIVLPLLVALSGITILINLILILGFRYNFQDSEDQLKAFPMVSVLIAARNEEENLSRCLDSLLKLDYPEDKLEILVGDDQSEDNTLEVAMAYTKKYPHIKVMPVTKRMGNAYGKANVLANLAQQSSGDYYFITDADIRVPHTWIKGYLKQWENNVGLITGITGIEGFAFQNLEWTLALGMIKVITDFGRPVVAMGNNMAVTKEAYQAVGGYESLPFSITEDMELFKHVTDRGYGVRQLIDKNTLAWSNPSRSFKLILYQRKRWLRGAMGLPFAILSILFFQLVFFPLVVILTFLAPGIAALTFVLKIGLQAVFIAMVQKKVGQQIRVFPLLFYEFYSAAVSLASVVFYFLPFRIYWKGRSYQ